MYRERRTQTRSQHRQVHYYEDDYRDRKNEFNRHNRQIIEQKEKFKVSCDSDYASYMSVTVQEKDFASYEIWNFMEQLMRTDISDLSVFRDVEGNPTGIVFMQTLEPVSYKEMADLDAPLFKGKEISCRMFETITESMNYLHGESIKNQSHPADPFRSSDSIVLVQGYTGEITEAYDVFGEFGPIYEIQQKHSGEISYLYIIFENSEGAKAACILDGARGLKVRRHYPKAEERIFAITSDVPSSALLGKVKQFGRIESHKIDKNGTIFILLENLECTIAACVLLSDAKTKTFFVDFDYYRQMA